MSTAFKFRVTTLAGLSCQIVWRRQSVDEQTCDEIETATSMLVSVEE